MQNEIFMKKAIELSKLAVEHGNEPFGAVLVKDDHIVFTNENQIYTVYSGDIEPSAVDGASCDFCCSRTAFTTSIKFHL